MKKRVISLLTATMMLVTVLPVNASANDGIVLRADSVTAECKAGETVSLTVSADENTGYVNGLLDICWDSEALELTDVQFNAENAPDNGSEAITSDGSYTVAFGDYLAKENTAETGTLFTLVFAVNDGAAAGNYPVMIANPDVRNDSLAKIPAAVNAGAVLLKAQTTTEAITSTTKPATTTTNTTKQTTTSTNTTKQTTTSTNITKQTTTTTTSAKQTTTTTNTTTQATTTTNTTKQTTTTTTFAKQTTTTTDSTKQTTTTTTSSGTTGTTTETTAVPVMPSKGDYNGDGDISIADAVLLARFVGEDTALTVSQIAGVLLAKPDFDSDGFVTVLDVAALLKRI